MAAIAAIIGLGNPDKIYAATRHNAGVWFLEMLAERIGVRFSLSKKFHGFHAEVTIENQPVKLLVPNTYMNHSGRAVLALAKFYQFSPAQILVAHDEMDFAPGVIRLKPSGGHGGHNGLRDIIAQLNSPDFKRLRIGVGRPQGQINSADYVFKIAGQSRDDIDFKCLGRGIDQLPLMVNDFQAAMQRLHTL